jgi:hypothetical protein
MITPAFAPVGSEVMVVHPIMHQKYKDEYVPNGTKGTIVDYLGFTQKGDGGYVIVSFEDPENYGDFISLHVFPSYFDPVDWHLGSESDVLARIQSVVAMDNSEYEDKSIAALTRQNTVRMVKAITKQWNDRKVEK